MAMLVVFHLSRHFDRLTKVFVINYSPSIKMLTVRRPLLT